MLGLPPFPERAHEAKPKLSSKSLSQISHSQALCAPRLLNTSAMMSRRIMKKQQFNNKDQELQYYNDNTSLENTLASRL